MPSSTAGVPVFLSSWGWLCTGLLVSWGGGSQGAARSLGLSVAPTPGSASSHLPAPSFTSFLWPWCGHPGRCKTGQILDAWPTTPSSHTHTRTHHYTCSHEDTPFHACVHIISRTYTCVHTHVHTPSHTQVHTRDPTGTCPLSHTGSHAVGTQPHAQPHTHPHMCAHARTHTGTCCRSSCRCHCGPRT